MTELEELHKAVEELKQAILDTLEPVLRPILNWLEDKL